MKYLYLLIAVSLVGCGKNQEVDHTPKPIELSHRMIYLSINSHSPDNTIDVFYLPMNDTIRIVGGNGGYTVTKIGRVPMTNTNTRIDNEARIVGDSLIVVTITGPTREDYKVDASLHWTCQDIYTVTDGKKKQTAFGIIDIGRMDMSDVSDPYPTFLAWFEAHLKTYDK